MEIERLGAVLNFAWRRWTAAEKALSRTNNRGAQKPIHARCEFWRRLHNRVEADLARHTAPARLAHLAASRVDDAPAFTRPTNTDLPEMFPDLPIPNVGVMLRSGSAGGKRV